MFRSALSATLRVPRPNLAAVALVTVLVVGLFSLLPHSVSAQSGTDTSFVGEEPTACDVLWFDGVILPGELYSDAAAIRSDIEVVLNQHGCLLSGEIHIVSPYVSGFGLLHGTIDGNFLRFTVPYETNDAGGDLNFSGLLNGDHIAGQYVVTNTGEVSDWVLATDPDAASSAGIRELQEELQVLLLEREQLEMDLEHEAGIDIDEIIQFWEGAIFDLGVDLEREIERIIQRFEREKEQVPNDRLRQETLSELDRELDLIIEEKWAFYDEEVQIKYDYMNADIAEIEHAKTSQLDEMDRLIDRIEFEIASRLGETDISLSDIRDATGAGTFDRLDQSNGFTVPTDSGGDGGFGDFEESEPESNRGFFSNSGSVSDLDEALDPTTLTVLGILITLAAAAVQLVKGN